MMNNITIQAALLASFVWIGHSSGMDHHEYLSWLPHEICHAIATELIAPGNINNLCYELTDLENLRLISKSWRDALPRKKINELFVQRCNAHKFKSMMLNFLQMIPDKSIDKEILSEIDLIYHTSGIDQAPFDTIDDTIEFFLENRNYCAAIEPQCQLLRDRFEIFHQTLARLALLRPSPTTCAAWTKSSQLRELKNNSWLKPPVLASFDDTITRVSQDASTFAACSSELRLTMNDKKKSNSKRRRKLVYTCCHAIRDENNNLFHCGLACEDNKFSKNQELYIAKQDSFCIFIKPEQPVLIDNPQLVPMPDQNKMVVVYRCADTQKSSQLICLNQFNSHDGSIDKEFGQWGKVFVKLNYQLAGELLASASRGEIRLGCIENHQIKSIASFDLHNKTWLRHNNPAVIAENNNDSSSDDE